MNQLIFKKLQSKAWSEHGKQMVFLVWSVLFWCLAGGLFWLVAGRLFAPGFENFFCFIGYPGAFLGFFGGALFLFNHDFS